MAVSATEGIEIHNKMGIHAEFGLSPATSQIPIRIITLRNNSTIEKILSVNIESPKILKKTEFRPIPRGGCW